MAVEGSVVRLLCCIPLQHQLHLLSQFSLTSCWLEQFGIRTQFEQFGNQFRIPAQLILKIQVRTRTIHKILRRVQWLCGNVPGAREPYPQQQCLYWMFGNAGYPYDVGKFSIPVGSVRPTAFVGRATIR